MYNSHKKLEKNNMNELKGKHINAAFELPFQPISDGLLLLRYHLEDPLQTQRKFHIRHWLLNLIDLYRENLSIEKHGMPNFLIRLDGVALKRKVCPPQDILWIQHEIDINKLIEVGQVKLAFIDRKAADK